MSKRESITKSNLLYEQGDDANKVRERVLLAQLESLKAKRAAKFVELQAVSQIVIALMRKR